MKQIINGKKYDTETANKIGEWDNRHYGNFSFCQELLYRKKTGELFLYGESGPAGKYSESCGQNQWTGSWKIFPLTEAEARLWAEKHLDAEEYQAIFGEVEE